MKVFLDGKGKAERTTVAHILHLARLPSGWFPLSSLADHCVAFREKKASSQGGRGGGEVQWRGE